MLCKVMLSILSNVRLKKKLSIENFYIKVAFSGANFGRIFGRKFRPMWPNIRFRPKLIFPLSVVHYSQHNKMKKGIWFLFHFLPRFHFWWHQNSTKKDEESCVWKPFLQWWSQTCQIQDGRLMLILACIIILIGANMIPMEFLSKNVAMAKSGLAFQKDMM